MYYYKKGGTYIATDVQDITAAEISEQEYQAIRAIIDGKPTAGEGYDYRLNSDMEWERYDIPEPGDELTAEEALGIIIGGTA